MEMKRGEKDVYNLMEKKKNNGNKSGKNKKK